MSCGTPARISMKRVKTVIGLTGILVNRLSFIRSSIAVYRTSSSNRHVPTERKAAEWAGYSRTLQMPWSHGLTEDLHGKHMRVLVVEDEQKVANALRQGLLGEQYDVAVEHSGEGAVARVNTETFDV